MTEAYPLAWPFGKPRKQVTERSRFAERSIDAATNFLRKELSRLGACEMILSTNLRLRNDGLPYSGQSQPKDSGVAVYFTHKKQQMCFACDRWDKVQDNIYAVAMTIEALRGIERWGTGDMVQQAFTGFLALPSQESPYDVLGVAKNATQEQIEAAYKQKAKLSHPDVAGGSNESMQRLNNARNALKG